MGARLLTEEAATQGLMSEEHSNSSAAAERATGVSPRAQLIASIGDPLRQVRVLKRMVQLFVYSALVFSWPGYYFIFDYSPTQMVSVILVGQVIAFVAIEGAFRQIFRLHKRSAYPRLLHQEFGAVRGEGVAATHAMRVVGYLLNVEKGCLHLWRNGDAAAHHGIGLNSEDCQRAMASHEPTIEKVIRTSQPMKATLDAGAEGGRSQAVVVAPVSALDRPIGVMILYRGRDSDLADSQLLMDVGGSLGLSLENWQQRGELRQGEERLKTVVTNVPVVLFALDREGIFTLSEGRGLDDLGLRPGEVVGLAAKDVYRNAPQILANIERGLAGESFSDLVEVAGLWWETKYSPIVDALGDVSGVIGVAANVTARKRAEDERRESETKYRALVEDINDIVYAQDENGTITYISPAVEKVVGYTADEIIGKPAGDFVHPGDADRLTDESMSEPREFRVLTKSGETRWLRSSLKPIENGSGPRGLRGVLVDITERVRAEDALRESEEKYRDLVENSNEVIFTLDTNAVVTYVSPAVKSVGGYKPEEVIGRPSTEFIHPEDAADVAASLQRVMAGDLDPTEYRLLLKSGDYRWVRSASKPIYADSTLTGVRGVLVDVTDRRIAEEAVQDSERRFRALVENSSDGIALANTDGILTYAGPSTSKILGYDPEELVGLNGYELIHPDDLGRVVAAVEQMAGPGGTATPGDCRIRHKDGSWKWIELVLTNLLEEPSVQAIVTNYRDVTERKLAGEALVRSEENHKALALAIPDLMLRVRRDGTVTDHKADDEGAVSLPEVRSGESTLREVLAEHADQFIRFVEMALTTRETQVFEYQQTVDGAVREFEARIVASSEDEAVAIVRDITERKKAEMMIRQMAYHDSLTGLPNRALFEDRLTMALAQARRAHEMLAVMFLDLDRFKLVNDTLGHSAGDSLLRIVGEELTDLLREGDTVARVGGDEFTLLLPGITTTADAVEVANRILARLKEPKRIGDREFRVTTSIGITVYPIDGDDAGSLLRNADTAMYRAKDRGRDNYQLFTSQMNETVLERLSLESDLRRAMENREFAVYFQPIAEVKSGHFMGAEALVRWEDPKRGLIPPDEFIPFAEESGLIVSLGEWVLREAVKQAKGWIDDGLPELKLTVNLSAKQLQHETLVDTVAEVLRESGLPPERLQLEITEGAMMSNVESAIRTLKELRHLGVGVAVDDFGTGYSSLSYLKRFPVDTVKIDRSFVRDLAIDANDAAIVTTVLAMAKTLDLLVVAEGVETRQQLEFLREYECHWYQGYLLSRPITGDEFVKLVRVAEMARPRRPRTLTEGAAESVVRK
jgi:diguanylate cyclase (GGDEF)-like protein/PAS domain S-box-containing protein